MIARKGWLIGGAVILVVGTLIIDLILGPDVVHSVPFVVLITTSLWLPWRLTPVILALIGTLLIVIRYLYTADYTDSDVLGYNLGLEIIVLWVTALLVMAYRRSAQSLEDREKRLEALIDTAVDGVIMIDGLGTVQVFNPACERLFGYDAEEVVGQNVRMLMPDPYCREHDHYLSRYRATGVRSIIGIGREVEGRRKDGMTFPMELSVGEAQPGGEIVFVGLVRDVTARHAAEESLRVAKEQAEGASRAKSVFLANVSHEIRTPMNAVIGYAQVLENDLELPDRFRGPLKAIRSAGDHLLGLIDDMLDLSKIEAGAMALDNRAFDLPALIEGLAEMFRIRCEQNRFAWRVHCDVQQATVIGDDRKLRQVLINLLGNAVKFTDQGHIALDVVQSGSRYRFAVSDSGPGITADGIGRLFEPFQQAEEGAAKGGTGLGLAISKRQVELMGGHLQVDSVPGEGATFHFELLLPAAASTAVESTQAASQPLQLAPGHRLKALVVDDVADNRDVLCRLLEAAGVEADAAVDGPDALRHFDAKPFDVVFMDVRMPGMDGIAVLQRMRRARPRRRFACIAVTASSFVSRGASYREAGFDGYLAKPFRFEQLCARLETHLGVEFRPRVPTTRAIEDADGLAPSGYRIPAELHARLARAAETNALTELESALSELRGLGSAFAPLADHFADLASRYDTGAIMVALRELVPDDD